MICPGCGKTVESDKKFCPKCGTPLDAATENAVQSNISPHSQISYIIYPITIVAVVFIIAAAYVIVNIHSSEKSGEQQTAAIEVTTENAAEADVTEAAKSSEETEFAQDETTYMQAVKETPSPNNAYEDIQNLLRDMYSYGWVNSTNYHDSSYITDYTVSGSRAYQIFGIEYWQERPDVIFDGIYDINVINIKQQTDGSYDAYVYYTYEIYHSATGKTSSNIELAIDNVVWTGSEFLVNDHMWKDDVPIGTPISINDY